jgi:predicted GNAT superfamily acetyltransferase
MRSPRVEAVLGGSGAAAGEHACADVPRVNDVSREGGWLVCAGYDLARSEPRLAVAIPPRFTDMLEQKPETARTWRMATREIFTAYLSRGYRVVDFAFGPDADRGVYLLEAPSPNAPPAHL